MTPQTITAHVANFPGRDALDWTTLIVGILGILLSLGTLLIAWLVYRKWARPNWADYDIDLFRRLELTLQELQDDIRHLMDERLSRPGLDKRSQSLDERLLQFKAYLREAELPGWVEWKALVKDRENSLMVILEELQGAIRTANELERSGVVAFKNLTESSKMPLLVTIDSHFRAFEESFAKKLPPRQN